MKLQEITQNDSYNSDQLNLINCSNCNKRFEYLSRIDDEERIPEYFCHIYLKCDCGEYMRIEIEVN